MGNALFATGLQKKMEKIGEDFLRLSISKHSDFYGACGLRRIPQGPMPTLTRQDAPVFTKIHSEFETSTRADVGIGPYNEIGNCVRIRRKFPKSRCFLPNAGLQGKIRVVVGVLGGGGADCEEAEGVVAEAAAAVDAGDEAAELADRRFIDCFPRELAIGTVAVDLLSEQHGKPPLFSFVLPPLYTLSAQIAMVLFAKQQKTYRTKKK